MERGGMLASMRGISKEFSGNPVLHGVDFDLAAGEVHVLAGENGAGKSTLMKILAGICGDYSGEVAVCGRPARLSSAREAQALGIAVIHQELSLVPSMSVADNVFLGSEIARGGLVVDGKAQRGRARELLGTLGIDIDPRLEAGRLPVPVRQMVEIAKALRADSRIIVMDEPTSALSDTEAERLFAVVRDLKERGCGIVYITHKMEEIFRLADRITVLRDGRLVGSSPAGDLDRETLVRWMVGRDLEEQIPVRPATPGRVRLRVRDFALPGPGGAVRGVSFEARAGEVVGFAGLQGSGNSALFAGIFGAYGDRASGEVEVDGTGIGRPSPRQSLRCGMALVTGDRKGGYVPEMSVAENITLASLPAFSPALWRRPRAEAAAAGSVSRELDLRCRSLSMPAGALSGGNVQKAIIGKWLLASPGVFLLDDPTRGIDVGAKHDIYRLIHRLADEGRAVLLISSEMLELLGLSDRILVMHRGRVTAEYPRGEATREKVLRAAMGNA
jgi:ribose transport system ATP-binding protein